jgi:hypothetical protein
MATVSDLTPEHELEIQLQQRRVLGAGLCWGGIALAIFAGWFQFKGLPSWSGAALYVLAGAAIVLAFLHWFARGGAGDVQQRLAKVRHEKRTFGMVLVIAGTALLLAAIALGLWERLQAFGEALSLAVLGLITLETGRRQLVKIGGVAPSERLIPFFLVARKPIGICLFVVGAVLALVGIWLRLKLEAQFPEFGGALLLGFIAIPAGLYLYLAEEPNVRAWVLVVGGLTGLVISVMVLVRAWLSRELFLGGPAQWRTEAVWKVWLCAYLELLGLLIMFSSVLVARAEIRVKPAMRLALYGYNSILTGMLLLALLAVLNVVVYVLFPWKNLDWTASRGLYALSPSSQDILEKLKVPVSVYVLFPKHKKEYREMHDLLDNAQAVTDKLNVKYIFPDSREDILEYTSLAQKYPELIPDIRTTQFDEDQGRGVLVVYGTETDGRKAPHVLIPPRKIVKEDFDPRAGRQKKQYIAESSFMTELQYFMEGQKKSKVYFLQGDDELDVNESRPRPRQGMIYIPMNPFGAGVLVDRLKKENFEVSGLSFAPGKDEGAVIHVKEDQSKRKDIPSDARTVVIAGPSEPLSKETLDALDRYMEKDGRLIITFDVVVKVVNRQLTELKQSGLEDWLKKFNVDVGGDFIHRLPLKDRFLRDPRVVLANVPLDSENMLAKKLRAELYPFTTVRVVKPGTKADKYRAEVLLEVSPRYFPWAESNLQALVDPALYALQSVEDRTREPSEKPIPMAVTVSEGDKPRLVVIGDTEFISNANLSVSDSSYSIFASALDWLADRPGVGARPKESSTYSLSAKAAENVNRMANLPLWLMILVTVGMGAGLWVVRRR